MQLAFAIEQTKLQQKQLEGKDVEKVKVEQVVYDAGTTKIAPNLIAQLKDVARAFCLEVQGEALTVAEVNANSDLRGTDKVYYPLEHRIAPNFALPPHYPSSTSSAPKSTTTPTFVPFARKEKEQQTSTLVVELEPKEVVEVEQLKKKKKEKEKEVVAQLFQV